jgi:streptogramin lyase/predicted small lipoprotein YifL
LMRLAWLQAVVVIAIATLAACGGGGGHAVPPAAFAPAASATQSAKSAAGSVTLRITIPGTTTAAQLRRAPAYVSPSTQSMAVAVNGGSPTNINLTTGSPNCVSASTLTCSATIAAPVGNDTFVVTLYDATGGTGHALATKTLAQTVTANTVNTIPLVLNGVVNSIGVVLATQTVPAGVATSVPVIVNAYDAQNNIIVGPGNYADANGNALSIALAAAQSTPTVQTPYTPGSATLSATTVTGPTAALTMSYDGNALLSTQFTATVSGGAAVAPASATLSVIPTMYDYPTSIANSGPYSLTVGVDKQIWVTLFGVTAVEHFAPPAPGSTSLNATTFTMPDTTNQYALGIAPGSDGNMWIASWNSEIFVCSVLGSCSIICVFEPDHPNYVIDGGDGNMYVNQSYYTGPYRYAIATQLFLHDFGDIGGGGRQSIGADGRVWSSGGQSGCCYTPKIVALPTLTSANQNITLVNMGQDTTNAAAGPDGNIWYVQSSAGIVGHLTSLTSTSVTGVAISVPSGPGLRGLTAGPDGNMYFTEPTANNVARVLTSATTAAGITEYPVPAANAHHRVPDRHGP